MSSEGGRHEIEAARKRLAAAKKLSSLAKATYDAAEKEVKDAQDMLAKTEKRWEVIDIDNEPDLSSIQNGGGIKKRKVSLSPQNNNAHNNENNTNSSVNNTTSNNRSRNTLTAGSCAAASAPSSTLSNQAYAQELANAAQSIDFGPLRRRFNASRRRRAAAANEQQLTITTSRSRNNNNIANNNGHTSDDDDDSGFAAMRARRLAASSSQNNYTTNTNLDSTNNNRAASANSINQIEVNGCGISEANGIYTRTTLPDKIIYKSKGQWKGSKNGSSFLLHRSSTGNWVLGADSSIFYKSTFTSIADMPPKIGWEVYRDGVSPSPSLIY